MKTELLTDIHNNPAPISVLPAPVPQTNTTVKATAVSAFPVSAPPEQFASAYADRKARAGSFLALLDSEQERKLYQWFDQLSLDEILRRVTAPSPDGFGIQTHRTTLQRIRSAYRAAPAISRLEQMVEAVEDIQQTTNLSALDRVQKTISALLHERAFTLASSNPDSERIPPLLASINKLSALELKRQRLVLEREKLQSGHSAGPKRHRVDLNILRPEPQTVTC